MRFVYLVTYERQTESPYTWSAGNDFLAERLRDELEAKYPERKWSVTEKDVS